MDLVVSVALLSGLVLGLFTPVALVFLARWTRPGGPSVRTPDLKVDINVSSIRVEGIGGLGMVIVCVALAFVYPLIGQTVVLGFLLGVVAALVLIARRRAAPLPSSGSKPGANTTLAIDTPDLPPATKAEPSDSLRRLGYARS